MLSRKMMKVAAALDQAGRYSEADFITEVMRRMALDFSVTDPVAKGINKKQEEIADNMVDEGENADLEVAKPNDYGLGVSPGGHGTRPELIPHLQEHGGREVLDFTDPEVFSSVKNAFEIVMNDPSKSEGEKKEAQQVLQVLHLVETKGRMRNPEPQLKAYGWFGILANKGIAFIEGRVTPAGNPAGQGIEVIRKMFVPLPESYRRHSMVVLFLKSVLSGNKKAGHWMIEQDSANADKDPKKRNHEVEYNQHLSDGLAPRLDEIAKARKDKAKETGKGFPSRSIGKKELYVWYKSLMDRLRSGELTDRDYQALEMITGENRKKYGWDLEQAIENAFIMFFGEGRQDIVPDSGRRTFEFNDINNISQVPHHGEKYKYPKIPKKWPILNSDTGEFEDFDEDRYNHGNDADYIDYPDYDDFGYDHYGEY